MARLLLVEEEAKRRDPRKETRVTETGTKTKKERRVIQSR
jgi:hypothetical protein